MPQRAARTCQKSTMTAASFTPAVLTPFYAQALEVQDIDTLEDWEMAELKYQLLHQKGELS